jgi:hypothetical protein
MPVRTRGNRGIGRPASQTRLGENRIGNRSFAGKRSHRRGLHRYHGPVLLADPAFGALHQDLETDRDYAAVSDRRYEYRRMRRLRCVAPRIIQVGPIDKLAGPGPRLVYGSRNRCGQPEFVNLHKKQRAKKAKYRQVRK